MDHDRITTLLEQASERYNEARYDDAIRLWQDVLQADPANQKAREGIRMANLLAADWGEPRALAEETAPIDQEETEAVRARVEAGILRVRELLATGEFAAAKEGCALLEEIAPNLEEVRRLAAQAEAALHRSIQGASQPAGRAAAPAGSPVESHLAAAREALAAGRTEEAALAARAALGLDPANMEAIGILSLAGDSDGGSEPVEIGRTPLPPRLAAKAASPLADFDLPDGPISLQDPPLSSAPSPSGSETGGTVDSRIAGLLKEGQSALDRNRPEEAISIWSRIFALDQTNAEAGTLIDRARAALEEQARQTDDLYYRALDAKEAGRRDEARDLLRRVLEISPNHPEARGCLEELEAPPAGEHAQGDPGDAGQELSFDLGSPSARKRPGPAASHADNIEPASIPLADHRQTEHYPPRAVAPASQQGATATVRMESLRPRRAGGGARRLAGLAAGLTVVAAAGVGAWLWFGRSGSSMPEAQATSVASPRPSAPPAGPGPAAAPGPAAPRGADTGLKVLLGAAPAQAQPAAPPSELDPEAQKARGAALEREGRSLYQREEWAAAALTLKKSLELNPIDFASQEMLDHAVSELEKQARIEQELGQATRYFGEEDFASALHKFYRLQQDFPEMRELERYIRNSWFNWGVVLMQAGSASEAAEKFGEVLELRPQDREASRAREIAQKYAGRSRDAVYDAFASSLSPRSLDQN